MGVAVVFYAGDGGVPRLFAVVAPRGGARGTGSGQDDRFVFCPCGVGDCRGSRGAYPV